MPKGKTIALFMIIIVMGLLISACGGGKKEGGNDGAQNNGIGQSEDQWKPTGDPNLEARIEIWAIQPSKIEPVIPSFNKYYPKIKVEVVNQGFDVVPKAQTAIAAGKGGPDIISYHFNSQGLFNTGGGLVDLMQPPYNAGRFREAFTEANWDRWLSFDGKQLFSFPHEHLPLMLFYRADILEEYGYPTDPEELAEYLDDKDNYINMALTFKNDDKYIMTLKDKDLSVYLGDRGFFDRNLNYTRTEEELLWYFDLLKEENQLGLVPNLMIVWSDEANQAIATGKLVMLKVESTFSQFLKEVAPDTEGKWRATRLPFGAHSAFNGLTMSILEQSKNKEAAWAFIEFALGTLEGQKALVEAKAIEYPGFKPVWETEEFMEYEEPFLGGQRINAISKELLDKVPAWSFPTPLDDKARSIWERGVGNMIENNIDSLTALQQIRDEIEAAVSADKNVLLEQLNQ